MDLEQRFKEETGFDAYKDNDLEPRIPLGYYVEWLEDRLLMHKDTLLFHLKALTKEIEYSHCYGFEDVLEEYIKSNAL